MKATNTRYYQCTSRLMHSTMCSFLVIGLFCTTTSFAHESSPSVKRITVFTGKCRYQLVAGFFPCDSKVAYVELSSGRAFLTFTDKKVSFAVSGGSDRQPNLENYYQGLDTIRMLEDGQQVAEDKGMEGECHFRLNKKASNFGSS